MSSPSSTAAGSRGNDRPEEKDLARTELRLEPHREALTDTDLRHVDNLGSGFDV
jgi:hypothetical protein